MRTIRTLFQAVNGTQQIAAFRVAIRILCARKHRKLTWCADLRVSRSNRRDHHLVTMRRCNSLCPALEFGACPLEAVIGVAERPGGQGWKAHVILGVRRGEHNRARPGELEHDALEGCQTGRVKMLNHLDYRCRIEATQARIPGRAGNPGLASGAAPGSAAADRAAAASVRSPRTR